jgi:hypothetical protein
VKLVGFVYSVGVFVWQAWRFKQLVSITLKNSILGFDLAGFSIYLNLWQQRWTFVGFPLCKSAV